MRRDAAFEIERAERLSRRIQNVAEQLRSDRDESAALEGLLAQLAGEPPAADVHKSLDEAFGFDAPRAMVARASSMPTRTAIVRA